VSPEDRHASGADANVASTPEADTDTDTDTDTGSPSPTARLDAFPDAALVAASIGAVWLLLVGFAVLAVPGNWTNAAAGFVGRATILVAAYAMLVLALNLHWGYAGLFNIGVAGFMAVGAYTTAVLTAPVAPGPGGVPGFGLPLPVGLAGGMVVAALVGAATALPALKLRADYLAIVTVALSEIIRLLVNWEGLADVRAFGVRFGTGGGTGLPFPAPSGPVTALLEGPGAGVVAAAGAVGVDRAPLATVAYGLVLLAVVAGFYWLLARIGDSPFGRVLRAIREDELVAKSLGKDTRRFKMKAFMIGCALMGLAGALFRGQAGYLSPDQFRPDITFFVFAALIVGGAGSNTGSVLGAVVFAALLFYLPARIGEYLPVEGSSTPDSVVEAVAALGGLDPFPLIGYAAANVGTLRFVAVGAVLVYLVQNRPDGLLGHRVEPAAAVDLTGGRPSTGESGATPAPGTAGNTDGDGDEDEDGNGDRNGDAGGNGHAPADRSDAGGSGGE